MRRKAASLLLVAMMMSVAVPVHASEQATVTIQDHKEKTERLIKFNPLKQQNPNHQLHRLQQQLREKKK